VRRSNTQVAAPVSEVTAEFNATSSRFPCVSSTTAASACSIVSATFVLTRSA